MFSTAFVLVCVLGTQTVSCPDCGTDPRRASLCELHAEIESVTLREQRRQVRSKEPAARIGALERVAALTHTHANVATVNVARFLAEGLVDDSLAVRKATVKLLIDGQNADEAARGMVRGLEKAKRTWAEIEARVVGPGTDSMALTIDELTEVPEYFESVLVALGKLRDERSLQALTSYVRSPLERTPGRFLVVASEATLALDTRRGAEAVVGLLEDLEHALAVGAIPVRFPRAEGRRTLLDTLKEPLENANGADYDAIVALLRDYASAKPLPLPDTDRVRHASAWRAWLDGARTTLPDRVSP